MNGADILIIALCLALCAVVLWYTVRALQRLEALPKRRVPERAVYEADWDRILAMTQLKPQENKRVEEKIKEDC